MSKKLRLFAMLAVFFWDLIFGCRPFAVEKAKELQEQAAFPYRALWVWDATVIADSDAQENFFTFLGEKKIRLIFLDVGNAFIEKNLALSKAQVSKEALAQFVSLAHDKGIAVYALDGDASWAKEKNHQIPLERLQRALDYNQSVDPKARLDGFQFDIEPYTLPEFKTEEWENVLKEYLSLASKLHDKVVGSSFSLGFAIPFWGDVQNPARSSVSFRGVKKPVAYHLIDILNELPKSHIAVMAYRDQATGEDGSIRHSLDEMNYVNENAPNVTVFVGQETADVKGEPEKITFYQEGEEALEEAIAQLVFAFKEKKCFGGIAIHSYKSYRELQKKAITQDSIATGLDLPFAIVSPMKGDEVFRITTVQGTAAYAEGRYVEVWVFPYNDRWYLQDGQASLSKTGEWKLVCYFGNEQTPKGYKFKIKAELKEADGTLIGTTVLDYVQRGELAEFSDAGTPEKEQGREVAKMESQIVDVTITSPLEGEAVANVIQVKGQVRKLKTGEYLLILVRPLPNQSNQSWWVQAAPVITEDGNWSATPIYIGQLSDYELPFRIAAVITGQKFSQGTTLPKPPDGPSHFVNVTRKKPSDIKRVPTEAPPLPEAFQEKLENLLWVAYAPTNFDPRQGLFPSEESIKADLQVLRDAGFNGLVTYSADLTLIPSVAQQVGFQGMLLGVYNPKSTDELLKAREAAKYDIVVGLVVGNEGMDSPRYDYETLRSVISDLRQSTGKPVTTTEEISDYADERLLELGDWLFPNVHPYWHGITEPQEAVEWTVQQFEQLKKRSNKIVVFKECGLPSSGDARVDETKQAEYYRLLKETTVHFVAFEAFDGPWKDWAPVEPHWGLFYADRTPKSAAKVFSKKTQK